MLIHKYFRYSIAGMLILVAAVAGLISLITPRATEWTIYQATAIELGCKNVMHFDSTVKFQDLAVNEIEENGSKYQYLVKIYDTIGRQGRHIA